MRKAFKVCGNSFRKWRGDLRVLSVLLLMIVFTWGQVEPVRDFCVQKGLSISCWYFPMLFSVSSMTTVLFYFGVLLMFCDAPFIDSQQMYVILRTGRKNWFLGKILYIFLTSIIYFLVLYIISVIGFVPYIGFSTQWESVIMAMASSDSWSNVSSGVIGRFTPIAATLLCYLLNVLIGTIVGLLVFLINLCKGRMFGIGIGMALVLITGFVNIFPVRLAAAMIHFSPVSWSDLTIFTKDYGGVTVAYVMVVLVALLAALVTGILVRQRSYNIEAMEEL